VKGHGDAPFFQITLDTCCMFCHTSQTYLREFLEVGGVQTLLELISVKQAKEQDKTEAINVLYSVADSGRKYKEHICECYGMIQHCVLLFLFTLLFLFIMLSLHEVYTIRYEMLKR